MVKSLMLLSASVLAAGGLATTASAHNTTTTKPAAPVMSGATQWKHHGMAPMMHLAIKDVASALKISPKTLHADLKAKESLATIAQKSGASASSLESTLIADATSQIQKAVSTGKMTTTQASHLKSRLTSMVDHFVTQTPPLHPHFRGHRGPGMMMGGLMHNAATTLNISPKTIHADLKAKESLATIAQKSGSSASALESTLISHATGKIQKAESTGKMTTTQASHLKSRLTSMVDHFVTQTPPLHPHFRGHRGPGLMMGGLMHNAATTLNISPKTLHADLKAKESLATIAQKSGSSASALESTLISHATGKIQKAESAGKISASQASHMKSRLTSMVDHFVTQAPHHGWTMGPHHPKS